MAEIGLQWKGLTLNFRSLRPILIFSIGVALMVVIAEARLKQEALVEKQSQESELELGFVRFLNFLWQKGRLGYTHVWPVSLIAS